MSIEELDQLDVADERADQIARPASNEVCRRQWVEQLIQTDAEFGQQPVRQVMRNPRVKPA